MIDILADTTYFHVIRVCSCWVLCTVQVVWNGIVGNGALDVLAARNGRHQRFPVIRVVPVCGIGNVNVVVYSTAIELEYCKDNELGYSIQEFKI